VPATSVHAHFPTTHLSGQTHLSERGCPAWKRVASERAKRMLWLVAATKLARPLFPGRSCGEKGGAAIRSRVEIIGKKKCDNQHPLQVDPAPSAHLRPPKRKRRNSTLGKNDKFREQETRVAD
jgi:hypothetical protein